MVKDLSNPAFSSFLLKNSNSILIIEDAEQLVRDRNEPNADSTQAVSNLLNLSDGLLNDALTMQIIVTCNCDLTSIDPALLRSGRLIINYAFDRLNVDSANRLMKQLGFVNEHTDKPMTLAEIYNNND
jgi:SpoVK/Ycf46/Vps4 family AAA+-type ATPase